MMRIVLIAILAGLWLAEPALAACTQNTVMTPDGRMHFCTTCCTPGGHCQTTCI